MSLKIGLFTLQEQETINCTDISIYMANHIAGQENISVAIVEPKSVSEELFKTARADFMEDGTFIMNHVRYYPANIDVTPTEDVLIYDFREINILHQFESDFQKLYACSDGSESSLNDIQSYIYDAGISADAILIGASKENLTSFTDAGFKSIVIGEKKESCCPYNLALMVDFLLRSNGILPPEYHKDWTYAEVKFHYVPEPDEMDKTKKIFSFLNKKKKKKEDAVISEIPLAEPKSENPVADSKLKENDTDGVVMEVLSRKQVRKSNCFEEISFIDVPAPVPKDTKDQKQLEAERLKAEQLEAERLEAERLKAEQLEAERLEAERLKAEQLEAERQEAERQEKEHAKQCIKETSMNNGVFGFLKTLSENKKTSSMFKFSKYRKPNKRSSVRSSLKTNRLTVFVTGLRHSCGASYIASSVASAMTDIYSRDVWLEHKGECIMPDNIMVHEVTDDDTRFNAFKSGIIVQDKGLYKELSESDKNDMMRADVTVMVCTAEENDLRKVAQFIHAQKDAAHNWLFVFNHVKKSQERILKDAMDGYSYIIVPFHDNAEVPRELQREWLAAINFFINS